jgi:hypothetical protein
MLSKAPKRVLAATTSAMMLLGFAGLAHLGSRHGARQHARGMA